EPMTIRFLHFSMRRVLTDSQRPGEHDTTSHGLAWALYAMLRYPSYLPRLQAEIDSLPLELSSNTELSSHLPLLEAFISESLRLHPPTAVILSECTASQPVVMPGGAVIKPGDRIYMLPWIMARCRSIWGEDAEVFRPERWMEGGKRKSAYEFPVFFAGPRNCPGQQLGRSEMIYTLTVVLREFEFEAAWPMDPKD
ncbi:hypothetical protein TREMEDRAFT_18232, partial [Tremella mesenterica DSM 1558]|uniref:uncharacterized protein n=1 Tax=Tremella mesenterica (strain ATCC 24925 / CBS 8224 / DSM 1558 / NBRC 9311 / NRRL Y-6157 / RJB 2259-6 / UBC 559-6) TaxID=578456 RepID=UPI00032D4C69